MSKKYSPELAKGNKNSILIARSAPLPLPSELKEYEKILPGITDRMMSSYEKQQAHRMELEKMVVRSGVSNTRLGQIFAFILSTIVLSGGILLIFKGLNIAGFSILVASTATLIGAFLYGKLQNRIERENKAEANPIVH